MNRRTTRRLIYPVVFLSSALLGSGCTAKVTPIATSGSDGEAPTNSGSAGAGGGSSDETGGASGSSTSGQGGAGGGASNSPVNKNCGLGLDDKGCTCPTVGATQACCTNGNQTCTGAMEFLQWGPCKDCRGSVVTCATASEVAATCDAAAPPPPDAVAPPGCECKPTTKRWCDEGKPGTEWSRQVCDAAGHWSACVADVPLVGCNSGYDTNCCVKLGYCCQDGTNGPFKDNGNGACLAIKC